MKSTIIHPKLRIFFGAIFLLYIFSNETGCYTATILTQDAVGSTEISKPVTLHRFLWGLVNSNDTVPESRHKGLHSVFLHTTCSEAIVTIFTLGIYCPIDYTWTFSLTPAPKPIHPSEQK
jgi:hypothetical protein